MSKEIKIIETEYFFKVQLRKRLTIEVSKTLDGDMRKVFIGEGHGSKFTEILLFPYIECEINGRFHRYLSVKDIQNMSNQTGDVLKPRRFRLMDDVKRAIELLCAQGKLREAELIT